MMSLKLKEIKLLLQAFLGIENHEDFEIGYAAEIYIPVMKRLVEEARKKIKELVK